MTSTAISISTIQNAISGSIFNPGGSVTNIAIGNGAAKSLADQAHYNIALGDKALQSLTTGSSNTVIGAFALNVTAGGSNVAIGSHAGVPSGTLTKVTNCVAIGQNTQLTENAINQIAIGYGATCTKDDSIQLGNDKIKFLYCQVPVSSQGSDTRLKEEVEAADLELCKIAVLSLPVTRYKYKDFTGDHNDKHVTGFMADDVEIVFPKSVHKVDRTFETVDENGNKVEFTMKDVKHITMTEAVPTLWGALQNALQTIEGLQSASQYALQRISALEAKLKELS